VKKLDASNACRASAIKNNSAVRSFSLENDARVDETCQGDDCGAVLVVVHDRDGHQLLQTLLDNKAVGSFNIF
jgi:hypothetical protein